MPQQVKRINLVRSVGNSSKQMQQTSGSSFCCCGDGDEVVDDCFVVVALSSLSPSFLNCGGGDDEGAVGVLGEVDMVVFGGFSCGFYRYFDWFGLVRSPGSQVLPGTW